VADLGFTLENQAQIEILTEETLKTALIEGESLNVQTVRSSVARKLGLPSAGLKVDHYIDGLVSVLLDATKTMMNLLHRNVSSAGKLRFFRPAIPASIKSESANGGGINPCALYPVPSAIKTFTLKLLHLIAYP